MMNIFGSNYSEVGSLSENFVINTAGKVKIRFGSKFIDILDDRGNLNVPVPKVITKITLKMMKLDMLNILMNNSYLMKK